MNKKIILAGLTVLVVTMVGCGVNKEAGDKVVDTDVKIGVESSDEGLIEITEETSEGIEKDIKDDANVEEDKPVEINLDSDDIVEDFNKMAEINGYKKFEHTTGFVEEEEGEYIIVFTSKYCGACKMYTPILFSLNNTVDAPNIYLVELTDETNHEFANELGIEVTPTTVVVNAGEVKKFIEGSIGTVEELKEQIK